MADLEDVNDTDSSCYQTIFRLPEDFGTTTTVQGTFMILYKLNILVQWGRKQYKEWFNQHIFSKITGTVPDPQVSDEERSRDKECW